MTIHDDGAHAVHDRFDRVEALLSRYPELAEAELAELLGGKILEDLPEERQPTLGDY